MKSLKGGKRKNLEHPNNKHRAFNNWCADIDKGLKEIGMKYPVGLLQKICLLGKISWILNTRKTTENLWLYMGANNNTILT